MSAGYPIPADRADAFSKAIAAFHNWTAEESRNVLDEPAIVQRYSISELCDLLTVFDDPMPNNVYDFLCWLAAKHGCAAPDGRTYANGAKCLKSIREKFLSSKMSESHGRS